MNIPAKLIPGPVKDATGNEVHPGEDVVFHVGDGSLSLGNFLGYTVHTKYKNYPYVTAYFKTRTNGFIRACHESSSHQRPQLSKFIGLRNV